MKKAAWLVLAVVIGLSDRTLATGFFINQQSVRGLGRVDAGNTVVADELGTIFFNPAGLTKIWDPSRPGGIKISIGTHVIIPRGDQVNHGSTAATPGTLGAFAPVAGGNAHNPTDPTPVPNFYSAMPMMNGRAAFGFGLNAPFGLTTTFAPDWHGRYDATDASLRTVNAGFVGSYRLDPHWSIGGGLDVQYAKSSLSSAIPNPLAPGGPTAATDASISTSGHDYTPGYNAGALYSVNDGSRVGFHYRSGMKHEISGSSTIAGLPAPLAAFNGVVDAKADVNLPAIATVGAMTTVAHNLVLLGEFEWFDWSTFKEVRIRFADGRADAVRTANYRDAYAVAFGAEHPLKNDWTLRGGVHFDTTPTVDAFRDTTVPDSDRVWLGFGASWRAGRKVSLDFAFNHVFFEDTNIALTRTFFDGTPVASAVKINSDVRTVVNTISVDFHYAF